jgi:hypothetical protein
MNRTSLEVAASLFWARLTLRKCALEEIRRRWGEGSVSVDQFVQPGARDQAAQLGRSTMWVARRLPFHCNCLVQSVALISMLRRRGIDADLKVGVCQDQKGEHGIAAHAWVEFDGNVILDSGGYDQFIPF